MNKLFFQKLVLLLLIFLLAAGCGDDAVKGINPQPFPTTGPDTVVPFHDPPLQIIRTGERAGRDIIVGAEEEGGGLFSALTGFITEGLKEGIIDWIGANTTGRILDIIGNKIGLPGSDDDLDEMNTKMDAIQNQLTDIQTQFTSLQNELSITQVRLENYISNTSLNNYITEISARFDTTDDSGLIYFSQMGSQLDPNSPDYASTISTLQPLVANYVSKNTGVLEKDVQGIHDAICPGSASPLNGVLKDYANNIILNPPTPNKNLTDPNNAMAAYLLLETYFSQILNYQTKACIIITEINNYKDPNGVAQLASSYLNGTYKTLLRDEVIQYQQTVNYLLVNMSDFRTDPNMYINDTAYTPYGIARDNTHLMLLARSRFFCAQVLKAFENDFGLYGAIVTPYDYSPGTNTPVSQITLQFSGPVTFTTTVNAQNMAGRFPYTKWDSAGHASPDNNWSLYDFSTIHNPNTGNYFDPNIPGGTYNVTLVDNGNTDNPWRHHQTGLGQVTIKYYDPNNPNPLTATTSPTQTNTMKFGCFSGRWNWGFSRINSSYMSTWVLPSQNSLFLPSYPYGGWLYRPNPTLDNLGSGYSYSPAATTGGPVNQLSIVMPQNSSNDKIMAYTIQLPVVAEPVTGASARLYYTNNVTASYSASEAKAYTMLSYYINLNDSTYMAQHKDISNHTITLNEPSHGTLDITQGTSYNIGINACLYCQAWYSCTSSGNISMSWYMQIVYDNTYNIF